MVASTERGGVEKRRTYSSPRGREELVDGDGESSDLGSPVAASSYATFPRTYVAYGVTNSLYGSWRRRAQRRDVSDESHGRFAARGEVRLTRNRT